MGKIEQKTRNLEKDLMITTKRLQDRITLMDCKMMELHLRFSGVMEEQGNIREKMVNLIAGYIQKPMEEINNSCDNIYRINSEYAKLKNLPQDVIVQLTSKRIRDEIIERQYKEPLLKEVIQTRKNYRKIIEKLNSEQIRYRWQVPEGLSFMWRAKRVWIHSMAK